MEKRAFYRVGFRALEILGFSSFKKRCPKVGLALTQAVAGTSFEPVLTNFSEIF